MINKCQSCDVELKLVEDFFREGGIKDYKEMEAEFERVLEHKWKQIPDYVCIKCGKVFSNDGIDKGYKIDFLKERVRQAIEHHKKTFGFGA